MSDTLEKCQHEGIHWFPTVAVEKYSPDQSEFAERKLAEQLSWGRRPLLSRFGLDRLRKREIAVPVLHGDYLRQLFKAPEDGYAYAEGNSLVNGGLTSIAYLLFGTTASGANGIAFKPGASGTTFQTGGTQQTGVGVGSDNGTTVAFNVTNTSLGGNGSSSTAWYQSQDATFPQWQGTGTPGQLNGQCTFASANANFVWNEWAWFTGTGTFTAGATLATVATNPGMWNRKITSLGTKASGASWVFTQTVTFS